MDNPPHCHPPAATTSHRLVRSTLGVKSFHLGPAQKVLGGQLLWAYEERAQTKVRHYTSSFFSFKEA
jgi:hypothetical protein